MKTIIDTLYQTPAEPVQKLDPAVIKNFFYNITPEKQQEAMNKWSKFGLLAGLNGYLEIKCALYMEAAAQAVLKASSGVADGSFETVIFPVVRRLNAITTEANLASILNEFYNFMVPVAEMREFEWLIPEDQRDLEADACAMFSRMIEARHVKPTQK